jgi:hypothetical protein
MGKLEPTLTRIIRLGEYELTIRVRINPENDTWDKLKRAHSEGLLPAYDVPIEFLADVWLDQEGARLSLGEIEAIRDRLMDIDPWAWVFLYQETVKWVDAYLALERRSRPGRLYAGMN